MGGGVLAFCSIMHSVVNLRSLFQLLVCELIGPKTFDLIGLFLDRVLTVEFISKSQAYCYCYAPNTKTNSLYVLNLLGNKVNSDSDSD